MNVPFIARITHSFYLYAKPYDYNTGTDQATRFESGIVLVTNVFPRDNKDTLSLSRGRDIQRAICLTSSGFGYIYNCDIQVIV